MFSKCLSICFWIFDCVGLSKSLVAKTIHCFSGVTIHIVVTGLGALVGSGKESVTSTSISTK